MERNISEPPTEGHQFSLWSKMTLELYIKLKHIHYCMTHLLLYSFYHYCAQIYLYFIFCSIAIFFIFYYFIILSRVLFSSALFYLCDFL